MAEILHDPTWLLTDWTTTPATLLVVKGQDGGYYVKNGRTGSIEFVEDDPSRAERAIQAAIDAAPPGGLIALTTGEFKISGTISLNKNGIRLRGSKSGAYQPIAGGGTVIHTESDIVLFSITATNIELEELAINGGKDYGNTQNTIDIGTGLMGICIHDLVIYGAGKDAIGKETTSPYSYHIFIWNCNFWQITRHPIHLNGGEGVIIHHNHATSYGGWGIHSDSGAGYWLVFGNRLASGGGGIRLANSGLHSIFGNTVTAMSSHGIDVSNTSRSVVIGNFIGNPGATSCGIYCFTYAGIKGTIIAYNTIEGDETGAGGMIAKGIGLDGSAVDSIVAGNVVRNATTPYDIADRRCVVIGNVPDTTRAFKATAQSVEIGVNSAYGVATELSPIAGAFSSFKLKMDIGGTFATGEVITVKVECVWIDGTTSFIEKAFTTIGIQWLTDDDILSLWKSGNSCARVNVYAMTDQASTAATCSVDILGMT